MRHRPELDGLRGIAVLLVLAAHARAPVFVQGTAGVTLFFALSGFLITTLLVAERDRDGRVSLPHFYTRRALRLLPALYAYILVVIAVYALGLWTVAPPDGLAIASVVAYIGNWTMIASGLNFGLLAHTWSLAVEEQFYLLWPAVLILGLRIGGRRHTAVAIFAVALLVTPWRLALWHQGSFVHVANGTDTHADALLIGCAIGLLRSRAPAWAGWLGVAAVLVLGSVLASGVADPAFLLLAAACSGLAVAGCPSALGWRPLAYIGRISYGLYLWHFLFIWSGLPWPVILVAAFTVSAASYRYLEQPFLRLKDRYARPGSPPSTAPVVLARVDRPLRAVGAAAVQNGPP